MDGVFKFAGPLGNDRVLRLLCEALDTLEAMLEVASSKSFEFSSINDDEDLEMRPPFWLLDCRGEQHAFDRSSEIESDSTLWLVLFRVLLTMLIDEELAALPLFDLVS